MKCPFCGEIDNKVIDSRLSKDGNVIRRRRECLICTRRFTTYEHIEEIPIMIIKKDGRREEFSREKIRSGIQKACEKRNISMNAIEEFIDETILLAIANEHQSDDQSGDNNQAYGRFRISP